VIERVYASDYYYTRHYYGSVYYGDTWCCSGVSVGLFFGSPYRRSYYPYAWYDPFYDPFFYDPFYYRPYYYRPAYWYPRPYRYYNYGYYHPRYYRDSRFYPRYNNWWDGTYRSRGFQSVNADYRDSRYSFRRQVNTVYTPPIGRFAEPERSSPLRRTVDRRDADNVAPAEKDRSVTPRRAATTELRKEAPARERRAEPRRRTDSDRPAPSVDRRRLETPGTVEARRAREPEPTRSVAEARDRASWPVDVTPRRSEDRPEARRAQPAADEPRYEARPSRPSEDRGAPAPRAEPRSSDGDRGRASEAPPSRSSGSYDGGRRSSGGSWGGGGGSSSGDAGGRSAGGGGGRGGGRRR
jgi:hypothetical protein